MSTLLHFSLSTRIVAKAGMDVSPFPSADHLASWAGLNAWTKRERGQTQAGPLPSGQQVLAQRPHRGRPCGCKDKAHHLADQHARLSRHLKGKKATVAVAYTLIVIIYHVLKDGAVYVCISRNGTRTVDLQQEG